jgi:Arc/MetJ family transcription regulator
MRTTVDINEQLLRQARRRAADEDTTLRAIVESALRAYLGRPGRKGWEGLKWRTESGRLQSGVRLDDRDALFDLMEGRR